MRGPALWIGDRVHGTNRHTGDTVAGELMAIEPTSFPEVEPGVSYAIVKTHEGERPIDTRDLRGPRRCYRPRPSGDWGADQTTCINCGRQLYANGPYDTDRLTHDPTRPAARYR